MKKFALIFFLAAAALSCAGPPKAPSAGADAGGGPQSAETARSTAVAPDKMLLQPAVPQPDETRLAPGLSVTFLPISVRHIDQVPAGKALERKGQRGEPVAMLDHRFDGSEPILGSGLSRGVAMVIEGFLRFEQPGEWRFRALSNDGIRVELGGRRVAEDPDVHGDRFTPTVVLAVPEAGWYPLTVKWFQRKGTAAIGLYRQPPGTQGFAAIPADAYRHTH